MVEPETTNGKSKILKVQYLVDKKTNVVRIDLGKQQDRASIVSPKTDENAGKVWAKSTTAISKSRKLMFCVARDCQDPKSDIITIYLDDYFSKPIQTNRFSFSEHKSYGCDFTLIIPKH